MATKTPAVKSSKSRAIVPWEDMFRGLAKKQAEAFQPSGAFRNITVARGKLMVDDTPVPDNTLDVVVLMAMYDYRYYASDYVEGEKSIPDCYAFGIPSLDDDAETAEDILANMAPHPAAKDPQAERCADCAYNKMGSAERGRGKRCSNHRRLAVILAEDLKSVEAIAEAEVRTYKVSVTSGRNWDNYAHMLTKPQDKGGDYELPVCCFITTMAVVDDPKTQWKTTFTLREPIEFDATSGEAMLKKVRDVVPLLSAPFQEPAEEEKPAAPVRGVRGARGAAPAPAVKPVRFTKR